MIKNNLNITIIQSSLFWEDCDKNLAYFTEKIKTISKPTDVIVLPEMFTTGFSMKSNDLAETMTGKSVEWMRKMSAEKNCAITGSLIIEENGNYYNRLVFVQENGTVETYDKRHLFRMANEHQFYTAGQKRLIINYKGWRICPLICYDLRFPVWSRNRNDCDLLIYVANWPEVRIGIWDVLLKARALENQVYVAAVNRIGNDGNNHLYSGNSAVISPRGQQLSITKPFEESVETMVLSADELNDFREKYPVILDADNFEINL